MDTIPFSQNWNNKLSGKYYTTIRLASAKYQPGKTVNITLRKKLIHQAEIVDCKYLMMENLNEFIIGLDMGLTLYEGKEILFKMYPAIDFSKQRLVLSLLRVIDYKKPKEATTQTGEENNNNNEQQEHELSQMDNTNTGKKVYPHNLTESQVYNSRIRDKVQMTYMLHQLNG